jgi:hypothetical protein
MNCPSKYKRFWLGCRWCGRGLRIAGLLVLLLVTIGFVWFNQIGLPDFAKTIIQEKLKERGLEVQFQRIYWKWFKGIVTEDLTVGPALGKIGPSIFIQSADVDLDLNALRRMELQIKSIELFRGSGRWEISKTNEPPKQLGIQNLFTYIRFLPDDQWELARFSAEIQGVRFQVSGLITNASLLQPQRTVSRKPKSAQRRRRNLEKVERQIYDALLKFEEFQFVSPPEISVELQADARERGEVDARIKGWARSLESPFGSCRDFRLSGEITRAADTNAPVKASITAEATHVHTAAGQARSINAFTFATLNPAGDWQIRWNTGIGAPVFSGGSAAHFKVEGTAGCDAVNTNHIRANFSLTATDLHAGQIHGDTMKLSASVEGIRDRRLIESVSLTGNALAVTTPWVEARQIDFRTEVVTNHVAVPSAPGWEGTIWDRLRQLRGHVHLNGTDLKDATGRLTSLEFDAEWTAPELKLQTVELIFPDAEKFSFSGELNASNRVVIGTANSSVHPDRVSHLLSAKDRRYLAQYRFTSPPQIEADLKLRLAEWTNTTAKWKTEVQPSTELAAQVSATDGAYRQFEFLSASTDLTITNRLLALPNLSIQRRDGPLELTYTNDMVSRDYQFGIRSRIDPRAVGPLLGEGERDALAHITLSGTMPVIKGDVWGRWGDLTRTGVRARTSATNIAFRGQRLDWLHANIDLTNQIVTVTDLAAGRPEGELHCPRVVIDIPKSRVAINNARSTLDFMVLPEIIGPVTAKAIRPYTFRAAPEILINGTVGTHRKAEKDSNLHFELKGPHFHWFKFNLENTVATLHWVTNRLFVTNLTADFHGGLLAADMTFDFDPPMGNDFTFDIAFTNTGFQSLIADVADASNKLGGKLSGMISVTNANTEYWDSWQGYGKVSLTNGLLWDMPVFGVFSPVLNAVIPGIGNSRANEAAGEFDITNSIIYTRNLVIKSPPARLYYTGTVDFDANIAARVEAKLFKSKFLVGQILDLVTSPITRIFEYKVTGTLAKPVSIPINIPPRLLMVPFQALRDIVEAAGGVKKKTEKK